MSLDIRVGGLADMDALKALRLAAVTAEPVAFLIDPQAESARPDEHWHAMLAGKPERFVVGAWLDGVAVGMVGFMRQTRAKVAHKGEIWGMYVDASARGRGVGRALLEALFTHARRSQGLSVMTLGVVEGQAPAVRLYESCGFRVHGRELDALRVGGVEHVELLMHRAVADVTEPSAATVVQLADRQLRAYNAANIDAFCACYSDDVLVLDESGAVTISGMDEFRPRYASLFETHTAIVGIITGRVITEPHLVEHEHWSRVSPNGTPESGEVLVRYTARGGKIAIVQFFKPTA